jgi:DNA-nicking Smr family endonuclease
VKYVRADVSHFELKKLRRGDYSPELFLDLHGLTQQQAKQELGALIAACRREHVFCACVMHGHGNTFSNSKRRCGWRSIRTSWRFIRHQRVRRRRRTAGAD